MENFQIFAVIAIAFCAVAFSVAELKDHAIERQFTVALMELPTYEYQNLTFSFNVSEQTELVESKINKIFGYNSNREPKVFIVSNLTLRNSTVGGYQNNSEIWLNYDYISSGAEFRFFYAHEYTHFILRRLGFDYIEKDEEPFADTLGSYIDYAGFIEYHGKDGEGESYPYNRFNSQIKDRNCLDKVFNETNYVMMRKALETSCGVDLDVVLPIIKVV